MHGANVVHTSRRHVLYLVLCRSIYVHLVLRLSLMFVGLVALITHRHGIREFLGGQHGLLAIFQRLVKIL